MPTDIECAYAAGIIDGEGSIGVSLRLQSSNSKIATPGVKVTVGMVDPHVVEWLSSTFGGSIDTHQNNRGRSRMVYRWKLHCKKSADFLEAILPYLRLKQNRAELAIKLARMTRHRGAPKGCAGNVTIDKDELAKRIELAMLIRAENQRSNPRIASYAKWGITSENVSV